MVVEPAALEDLARGDLVVVQRDGDLITHRLVHAGAQAFITKGDASLLFDPPSASETLVRTSHGR